MGFANLFETLLIFLEIFSLENSDKYILEKKKKKIEFSVPLLFINFVYIVFFKSVSMIILPQVNDYALLGLFIGKRINI